MRSRTRIRRQLNIIRRYYTLSPNPLLEPGWPREQLAQPQAHPLICEIVGDVVPAGHSRLSRSAM